LISANVDDITTHGFEANKSHKLMMGSDMNVSVGGAGLDSSRLSQTKESNDGTAMTGTG